MKARRCDAQPVFLSLSLLVYVGPTIWASNPRVISKRAERSTGGVVACGKNSLGKSNRVPHRLFSPETPQTIIGYLGRSLSVSRSILIRVDFGERLAGPRHHAVCPYWLWTWPMQGTDFGPAGTACFVRYGVVRIWDSGGNCPRASSSAP